MTQRDPNRSRLLLAWASGLMALVFFLAVNVWSNRGLTEARLDLTQDALFTVSEGTREVLAGLNEPVRLQLFLSKNVDLLGSVVALHARRVDELLAEYQRIAKGRLIVERIDPLPFSPEEDQAVSEGLRGIAASESEQIYFGLVGNNSTDDREVIRFLSPDRATFLEYDLTKLIFSLDHPEKPVLALIGALPLRGGQGGGYRPWRVLDHIQEFFEVRSIREAVDMIDEDVAIVMLAQPEAIDPRTLYAIDQFVLRGGRVMAFLDPLPENMRSPNPAAPPPPHETLPAMAPLLAAWGVEIPPDSLAGDRANAAKVQVQHQGRIALTDYVAWIAAKGASLARGDTVTATLQQINLRTTGVIRRLEDATTHLVPLIATSADSMVLEAGPQRESPDPIGLLTGFQPSGERLVIAARIDGPARSAFPDGPPPEAAGTAGGAHLEASQGPINVILVADSDILADENWVQPQSALGQQFFVTTANNGDFVTNALDNLSGSAGLIGLRGKGLRIRPFKVIEAMQREAEGRYRDKEKALREQIDAVREKIRVLQEEEQSAGVILTAEQQIQIENFRNELLDRRQELRDVQFALRKDVESLESWIEALNLWAVPLLIGLLALVLALIRRRQAARRPGPATVLPKPLDQTGGAAS